MLMNHIAVPILDIIKAHPEWAMVLIGLTAFGESFVFVSLLFPGTAVLVAAGGLIAAGVLDPLPGHRGRHSRWNLGRCGVILAGTKIRWRATETMALPRESRPDSKRHRFLRSLRRHRRLPWAFSGTAPGDGADGGRHDEDADGTLLPRQHPVGRRLGAGTRPIGRSPATDAWTNRGGQDGAGLWRSHSRFDGCNLAGAKPESGSQSE